MILLLLLLLHHTYTQDQITTTTPSLIFFTVNDCEDCAAVQGIWDQLQEAKPDDLLLDELNCDFQEKACHEYEVSKLPSLLYVSENGIREFEGDFQLENVMEFIENSNKVLIQGDTLLEEGEPYILHLGENDMNLLGKSHSMVYFMYDEEVEHVEDFVLSMRAHIGSPHNLPIYIIDCGVLTDICVKEPFNVQILPCIKFLGETVYTYTGDFVVERVEYWLQVHVYRTKEPEVDETVETITEDRDELRLVWISTEAEHDNIAYMEGALLAFYLNEESTELEAMFRLLSKKYKDTKDLQIFAVNCDEYNAPRACREFEQLPVVKHGFMGRLAKRIHFNTEEQFDVHIAKLIKIIEEGGHILEEEEKVEVKEEVKEEAADLPERSGHALIVTSDNFNATLENNKLVFLQFFVPWCGHCQKLKPTWKLLAQSFRDVTDIVVGMINCQNEAELCKRYMVYGYPTLFTFIDGKQTYRYREERALNLLIDHVKEKYYQSIEDDLKYNPSPFLITGDNVWNVLGVRKYSMVFFTSALCDTCFNNEHYFTETWKAIKSQPLMNDKLMLATVKCDKDLALCKEMNVPRVPYILLFDIDEQIDPNSAPVDPFLNPFKSVQTSINNNPKHLTMDVIAWQKKTNDIKEELEKEEITRKKREAEKHSILASNRIKTAKKTEPLTDLTEDTFKAQLKKSRFTFVKFYAPWCGHCRKLAPVWTALGEHYLDNDDIVIARVNCDAHEALCDKHKVTVFPALFLFENDKKLKHVCKKRKEDALITFIDKYIRSPPPQGNEPVAAAQQQEEVFPPERTLKDVQGAVWQLDREDMVKLLDNKKQKLLFVLFYNEADKKKLRAVSDTWGRIATLYLSDRRIVFGQVDCDIEMRLCLRYQSNTRKDYPQIFMFDKFTNISHECLKRGENQLIDYVENFLREEEEPDQPKDEL